MSLLSLIRTRTGLLHRDTLGGSKICGKCAVIGVLYNLGCVNIDIQTEVRSMLVSCPLPLFLLLYSAHFFFVEIFVSSSCASACRKQSSEWVAKKLLHVLGEPAYSLFSFLVASHIFSL
eukprot:c16267_g1_i1.p1 GENE.c16267_g1_i1~~c16267_g1_i1.p1  ORF type:complete len:119 (+),score=6.88 c16267_g1_i1:231-587(+)